jgi:hypothetical protein
LDEGQMRLLALIALHHDVEPEEVLNQLIRDYNELHLQEFVNAVRSEEGTLPLEAFGPAAPQAPASPANGTYTVSLKDMTEQLMKCDQSRFSPKQKKILNKEIQDEHNMDVVSLNEIIESIDKSLPN